MLPSPSPYESTIHLMVVRHWYMESVHSIRKVDFANLRYYIGHGDDGDLFQLRHGKIAVKYDFGFDQVTLDHVYHFYPGKTEPEAAVVDLTHLYGGGSSCFDGIVLVFQIDSGGLVVTQQLVYDHQAEGAGAEFDPPSGTLTIRARSNDDTPHCCPKNIDIVTFKWTGKGFEEQSHRTVPIKGR
jgi:hypothetical protein